MATVYQILSQSEGLVQNMVNIGACCRAPGSEALKELIKSTHQTVLCSNDIYNLTCFPVNSKSDIYINLVLIVIKEHQNMILLNIYQQICLFGFIFHNIFYIKEYKS